MRIHVRTPLLLRLVQAAFGSLLGVAALYVVAMNVFLSTSLFARVIDRDPDAIDIHYRRGWSIVPGRIHARGLSIRGRDGNVEWILRLDEVVFDVSFRALTKQRFEASNVHGRGMSFRLRRRLEAPPSSAEVANLAGLPPIEGFGPYAIRPPPTDAPEIWSDAAYHLWTPHLEGVVADDVREIWIDNAHFEGNARITGRFYLKPVRRVDVGPIRIDVRNGHVRTGSSVLFDGLAQSTAELTVAPFDPRIATGSDILRKVSVAIDAQFACPDIARIPLPLPNGIEMTGDAAVRRLVFNLRDGTLQDGSSIDAILPRAVVTRGEYRFAGDILIGGTVRRTDGQQRFAFRTSVAELDVIRLSSRADGDQVLLHIPHGDITGDSRDLGLSNPLSDVHVLVTIPQGNSPDLRALSTYIPANTPVALKGGTGRVSLHFEAWAANKTASGGASLRSDNLGVQVGQMRVQGAAVVDASLRSVDWETSLVRDGKLTLEVSSGSIAWGDPPEEQIARVGHVRFDAQAATMNLNDPLRSLQAAISVKNGEIVDDDLLRAYLPKGSEMHLLPGKSHFSLACEVALVEHLARGTLDVTSDRLGFGFRDFRLAADVRAKAQVRDWHWQRGDLTLDRASVAVTNVSVLRPGQEDGEAPSGGNASPAGLLVERISIDAKSSHFTFTDPLAQVVLSASLVNARAYDTALINAFMPSGVPFLIRTKDGAFSGGVDVAVGDHIVEGSVVVRATNMDIAGKAFHIGGDVDVLAEVSDWDFAKSTLAVRGAHVGFAHVSGGFYDARADRVVAGAASEGAFGKPEFRAERVELWASTPELSLVAPSRRNLDARVVVRGADLPDATVLQRFLPPDSIVGIDFGQARLSADLDLSSSQKTAEGRLDVELPHTGIRFHDTHLAGNFELSARLAGFDSNSELFDLSGTRFTMHDVEVTNASTDASHWEGEATFKKLTLRLEPEPKIDGLLSLEARDASPVLAILLGNALPKIFVGLTRMPNLSASARWTMGADRIALRDLDAHGGDLSIQGLYVIERDHRAGAFVVAKGPFSAGFGLGDDGVHLHLFGLKTWLEDQTRASLRLLDARQTRSGP
jgi:hypothetical protein